MKGRHVMLFAFTSLVINGISLYNLLIGYISIFMMLIVFIPNLFIKSIELGKKAESKGINNILMVTSIDSERNTHSKWMYMIGIIFLYVVGGFLIIFQIYQYDYIHEIIINHVHMPIYYVIAPYLVGIGYVLFLASLVMLTIYFKKLFREAPIFQGKKMTPIQPMHNIREDLQTQTDRAAQKLLIESASKSTRLSIVIPIVFALTVIITALTGVFLPQSYDGAIRVLIIGLSIGFSIMLIFYTINWFNCLSFLKETKYMKINDYKLARLIKINRFCCIVFMIPLIFFVGMFGFHKVKTFAEEKVRKGTLDQILYHLLVEK